MSNPLDDTSTDRSRFFRTSQPKREVPTDIDWLRDWGIRLLARGEVDRPASEYEWMLFRPDKHAADAMTRLSIQFPYIISQVQGYLDFAEAKYSEFLGDPNNESASDGLFQAMYDLARRIETAVGAIESVPTVKSAIKPWNPKPGYVGTKAICTEKRFQKTKNGVTKNPRPSTIGRWKEKNKPTDIDRDPATGEIYYPEYWVTECWTAWNPRA